MTHQVLLRVDRVEHWRPPYADGGPILTTLEVHDVRAASLNSRDREGPRLAFEHQGDGSAYVPTRLVLHFSEDVRDYQPGDYLAVSIEKADPPARDRETDDVPF